MVTRTTRYALRVLGYLVGTRGGRVSGEEISRQTGVPANYLTKILGQLRKQGFVDTGKGWGGGFELREEALERPIRDVLAVLEGQDSVQRRDCLFGLADCDENHPCPLHPWWERIKDTYGEMLASTRIADLAG